MLDPQGESSHRSQELDTQVHGLELPDGEVIVLCCCEEIFEVPDGKAGGSVV